MNFLLFVITVTEEESPGTTKTSEGTHYDYRIVSTCPLQSVTFVFTCFIGLTGGQIAGIVVGGVSVVAVTFIIIIIVLKKNLRSGNAVDLHSSY